MQVRLQAMTTVELARNARRDTPASSTGERSDTAARDRSNVKPAVLWLIKTREAEERTEGRGGGSRWTRRANWGVE